jgi:hypothetical protein
MLRIYRKVRKIIQVQNRGVSITNLSICFTLLYSGASAAVFMKFTTKVLIGSFKPSNPFLENLHERLLGNSHKTIPD